jgi:FAD/FMN-containing dehydrogenase
MNAKAAAKYLIFVFLLAFALLFFLLAADLLLGVSKDKNTWRPPFAPGVALDASGLDPVTVAETVRLSPDSVQALEQLHEAWQRARAQGLKIAIAGARHSMGDQSAYPNGIIIDMLDHNSMRLDSLSGEDGKQMVLHVETGARWSQVIQFLDTRGYSVRIMQANNPFTVGGTLSVNAHGWQHGQPPFGSTVEAFDLFTADGTVKHCDRRENAELFHLVIGGYGLFGVVLDADLRITQNVVYRAEHFRFPAREYARQYAEHVDGDT